MGDQVWESLGRGHIHLLLIIMTFWDILLVWTQPLTIRCSFFPSVSRTDVGVRYPRIVVLH